MSSQTGGPRDLWAEIISEDEELEGGVQPQIAVTYGRRRVQNEQNPKEDQILERASKECRVSFAAIKRVSWRKSLSIRGRESIVVAAGFDFRPQPKQRGQQKKPKRGLQSKKTQQPPDFKMEKAYFEEVDSVELVEESPSPKNYWKMGTKDDINVPNLPAILGRWKISKLAYSCTSPKQLFKIMETPVVPSVSSNANSSTLIEKAPVKLTKSRLFDKSSTVDFNESFLITSFDSLRIKDENETCEGVNELVKDDEVKGVDGAIVKESLDMRSKSLSGGCLSAFSQLLMVCRQTAPVRLSEVFSAYCDPSSLLKIGEGTFGEAFRAGEAVCKVVPIDGDLLVNGEIQKKSEEVLEEVLLSLTLNSLREHKGESDAANFCTTFIETKEFRVCQGIYDSSLLSAWEEWDAKNHSENDHPNEFSEEQCYIVFVLADGGKDLESFLLINYDEARSLLVQVTAALAVAEMACEFEHRDLHWGNILLRRGENTSFDFILAGKKMSAKTFGITISIIDFTLSRINNGEAILFLDLSADPELFKGPKGDRQSETYRQMRKVTEDYWEGSFPKTNVLWLSYLVDILLTKKSFKRTPNDEKDLRSFKRRLNSYDSAQDALSDSFFNDLYWSST